MANQKVYQILVYRHELFKINFTGVPSSSSPFSPRFFLALSLAFFFVRAPLSERLQQAMYNGMIPPLFDDIAFIYYYFFSSVLLNRVNLFWTVAAGQIGTTLISYRDVPLVLSKTTEFHNLRSTTPSASRHFSHVETI